MDLITDVVNEGEVEVIAVDTDAPCTLTATEDTWLKGSGQPSGELPDDELCAISAGDTLTVNYEYASVDTHRRVLVDASEACAATFSGRPAFAFDGHFEVACDSPVLAGVDVSLDGDSSQATDAAGLAVFGDVAQGTHDVATSADDFKVVSATFDQERYPGSRVVLVTRSVAGGDETGEGSGTTTGRGDESSTGVGEVGTGDPDTPEPEEPDTSDTDDSGRSLPEGFGEDDGGCSCRSSQSNGPLPPGVALLLLGLFRRRRVREKSTKPASLPGMSAECGMGAGCL